MVGIETNGHATNGSSHGPLAPPPGIPAQQILDDAGTAEELTAQLPGLHVEPLWYEHPGTRKRSRD